MHFGHVFHFHTCDTSETCFRLSHISRTAQLSPFEDCASTLERAASPQWNAQQVLTKQGEPENPKDKPDTRKPIFNVRWMLRVHFVIWVTISTWEPKRTSNGTATSLPPSPVSDCHAYNSSAFFSCQTDTTHQKTGKTLKSGVASFLPKRWDSTFTSVLVLASQQFKHLKCS